MNFLKGFGLFVAGGVCATGFIANVIVANDNLAGAPRIPVITEVTPVFLSRGLVMTQAQMDRLMDR